MPGDAAMGSVLRELRRSRNLSMAAVAKQVNCAESLISYVETGKREIQPWLAEKLDAVYGTGGAVVALTISHDERSRASIEPGSTAKLPDDDVVVVRIPGGEVTMPVSRRELLAGLGIGVMGGMFVDRIEQAMDRLDPRIDLLPSFEQKLAGFRSAARSMPPSRLIGSMIGQIALLDNLRRRAPIARYRDYLTTQARYAESLSWLCEEAGDIGGALYWVDRTAQWSQAAQWTAMIGYTFVRRSMLIINFTGNGLRAIDSVQPVLEMPQLSWVRGLAYKEMAMSCALARQPDESERLLDEAMRLLDMPCREDEVELGQRSVVGEDLYTVYKTTCDIYLGRGASVVPTLQFRLDGLANSSPRTATISRAKLACAFANAGQPAEACRIAWEAMDMHDTIGSHSTVGEVRRTVHILRRWETRRDVRDDIADLAARLVGN